MYTSATGANAAGNLKTVWSQKRYTKKCNNHKKYRHCLIHISQYVFVILI